MLAWQEPQSGMVVTCGEACHSNVWTAPAGFPAKRIVLYKLDFILYRSWFCCPGRPGNPVAMTGVNDLFPRLSLRYYMYV